MFPKRRFSGALELRGEGGRGSRGATIGQVWTHHLAPTAPAAAAFIAHSVGPSVQGGGPPPPPLAGMKIKASPPPPAASKGNCKENCTSKRGQGNVTAGIPFFSFSNTVPLQQPTHGEMPVSFLQCLMLDVLIPAQKKHRWVRTLCLFLRRIRSQLFIWECMKFVIMWSIQIFKFILCPKWSTPSTQILEPQRNHIFLTEIQLANQC